MNYNTFKSRTFWTVVAMFVIGGVNAIQQMIPAPYETMVMGALGLLATWFHVNPSQNYNPPA